MTRKFSVAFFVLLTAAITSNSQTSSDTAGNGLFALDSPARVDFNRPRFVSGKGTRAAAGAAEQEAFRLINDRRAEAGLEPLIWSDELAAVARSHSDNMAANGFFSHRGLDGSTVDDRADRSGVSGWLSIGENIAFTRGYDDAPAFAVSRWMQSRSHRQNLLDKRWTQTGIGVAVLPDGTYFFTQVFILRK